MNTINKINENWEQINQRGQHLLNESDSRIPYINFAADFTPTLNELAAIKKYVQVFSKLREEQVKEILEVRKKILTEHLQHITHWANRLHPDWENIQSVRAQRMQWVNNQNWDKHVADLKIVTKVLHWIEHPEEIPSLENRITNGEPVEV